MKPVSMHLIIKSTHILCVNGVLPCNFSSFDDHFLLIKTICQALNSALIFAWLQQLNSFDVVNVSIQLFTIFYNRGKTLVFCILRRKLICIILCSLK